MKEITRKCQYCKQTIYVEKEIGDFIVDEKNKASHINCFIERHINLKKKAWTYDKCNDKVSELLLKTNQELQHKIKAELKKEQEAERRKKHKEEREMLYDWLAENYEITLFPKYFYTKMEQIFSGTFKDITKPVPALDLLDMWQQKLNYLNKVNLNNKKNGKKIDGFNRINYDLAIVLSKYDSYLAWKAEKEIEKEEIQKQLSDKKSKINYQNNNIKNSNIGKVNDEINIGNILDEI